MHTMTTRKGCIIEFAGLAGCGKTYVRNLLMDKLGVSRGLGTGAAARGYLRTLFNLNLAFHSVRLMISSRPRTIVGFWQGINDWLALQVLYREARTSGELLVVDEGMIHKFRTIRRTSKRRDLMLEDIEGSILDRFHFADLVVLVEADPEDIVDRRKKRDRLTITNIDEAMSRVNLTRRDISTLVNTRKVHTFVVDNSSRVTAEVLDKQLDHICAFIKVRCGATPVHSNGISKR